MDSSLRLSFFFLFSVIDNIGTYQVCTSVPVLEQGLLYWEGASGKRQVTADNVGYMQICFIALVEFFYVSLKGPFKIGSIGTSLLLVFGTRLSKSGQNHSRWLIMMIDRQRADV